MAHTYANAEERISLEIQNRLIGFGICRCEIETNCRLYRNFIADVVVVDKLLRRPIMAFEIKRIRGRKPKECMQNIGPLARHFPYYLVVENPDTQGVDIARILDEKHFGKSVDWTNEVDVCQLLKEDYVNAKKFELTLQWAETYFPRIAELIGKIFKMVLPVILFVFFVAYAWLKCVMMQQVAVCFVIGLILLALCGIPIRIEYGRYKMLIGEWKPVIKMDETKEVNQCR